MLKEASLQGLNLVFFNKKSISIPAIAYMEERSDAVNGLPELPELTPEEHSRAKERLDEIRNNLKKKMKMN